MPVRNALPYLDAAVESILGQTFGDFELVIRDDNSTDGSLERLRMFAAQDSRIRLFEGDRSLGPAGSSNWVVEHARGSIIARMDADDVAVSTRLEKQLEILEANAGVVLLGSTWVGIDRQGRVVRNAGLTTFGESSFAAPFAHGSIMYKREAFDQVGGYRSLCDYWEDLDFYVRMARLGRVLVTTEALYQYRFSETSTRLTSSQSRVEQAVDLMFKCRAAFERGEDYTPLLTAHSQTPASSKHNPNTFISLGFIALWSGLRPPTLFRLLAEGDLKFNGATARALIWAGWAYLSPRTLRGFMRYRLATKTREVRRVLDGRTVLEWQPYLQEAKGGLARSSRALNRCVEP